MKFKTLFLLSAMLFATSFFSSVYGQKRKNKHKKGKTTTVAETQEMIDKRKAALKDLGLLGTDVQTDLDGFLTLRFSDALTGDGIKDASVKIAGIGTFPTDAEGKILFPNKNKNGGMWADGQYKTTFRKAGYITTDFETKIFFGSIFHNRMSVSPELNIKYLRAVLDWDAAPADLDIHFVKAHDYHISYRHTRVAADGSAQLDRDDTNGYGPETITVKELDDNASYTFFIHNYSDRSKSGSSSLSNTSRGVVRVYGDNKLIETIQVPEQKSGRIWIAFIIKGGKIQVVNKVSENIEGL